MAAGTYRRDARWARITTAAVMTGLVPVIHVVEQMDVFRLAGTGATWMAGTRALP
jgi:hypothetical protein